MHRLIPQIGCSAKMLALAYNADGILRSPCLRMLSHLRLFAAPCTGSSVHGVRQEYWSGVPFPSPGDITDPGIEPMSEGPDHQYFLSEIAWIAKEACLLLLGRQGSSRFGPGDHKVLFRHPRLPLQLSCAWILTLGLYSWPASQPQVSRTGPGNQGLSPYTCGFLHMCVLGNSNPYDWKWKAGAAWTRYILCLPGLLSTAAFCVECTRLVVVAPEAAPRDPPTLLHGLHK